MSQAPGSRRSSRVLGKKWKAIVAGKRRNKPSEFSIEQLAEELIVNIFHWVILDVATAAAFHSHSSIFFPFDEDYYAPEDPYNPPPYAWLSIRHVCRSWRRIALAHPQLSSHIFLTRPECVEDLLKRSGAMRVNVYDATLDYNMKHKERVAASCNLVLAHIGRISHARLSFVDETFSNQIHHMLEASVCRARSLKVMFVHLSDAAAGPFPPNVSFPDLNELCCYNYDITLPGRVPDIPHLRALRLAGRIGTLTAPAALLRVLAQMRGLEHLELDLAMTEDTAVPHVHEYRYQTALQDRASLPNLQRLRIYTQYAATGLFFMHHIIHPPTTALDISCHTVTHDAHTYCDCLTSIIQEKIHSWETLGELPFQCLYLACTGTRIEGSFFLCLWQNTLNPDSTAQNPFTKENTFFHFSVNGAAPVDQVFLISLLRALPLAQTVIFAEVVHYSAFWHMPNWLELFASLASLEALVLRYETHGAPRQPCAPARDVDVLLPRLKTLSVYESRLFRLNPSMSIPFALLANGLIARGDRDEIADGTQRLTVRVDADAMINWPRPMARLRHSNISRWILPLLPGPRSRDRR